MKKDLGKAGLELYRPTRAVSRHGLNEGLAWSFDLGVK